MNSLPYMKELDMKRIGSPMQISADVNDLAPTPGVPPIGAPYAYLVDSAFHPLVDAAGDYLVETPTPTP